jgi:hypothetical protein
VTPDFLALAGSVPVPAGEAQRRLGRGHPQDPFHPRGQASVSAFVDTNILVRYLTGDPSAMAARPTAYLASVDEPCPI